MYTIIKTDEEENKTFLGLFKRWKDAQEYLEAMNLQYLEDGYGYTAEGQYIMDEFQTYELKEA